MDTRAGDDWPGLADPLPHHPSHIRLCVHFGGSAEAALGCRVAIPDEPDRELGLHADSVQAEEFGFGGGGYCDRVGDNSLDDGSYLEIPPVGGASSGAVFGVGVDRYGAATEYHLVESVRGGKVMLGICATRFVIIWAKTIRCNSSTST